MEKNVFEIVNFIDNITKLVELSKKGYQININFFNEREIKNIQKQKDSKLYDIKYNMKTFFIIDIDYTNGKIIIKENSLEKLFESFDELYDDYINIENSAIIPYFNNKKDIGIKELNGALSEQYSDYRLMENYNKYDNGINFIDMENLQSNEERQYKEYTNIDIDELRRIIEESKRYRDMYKGPNTSSGTTITWSAGNAADNNTSANSYKT